MTGKEIQNLVILEIVSTNPDYPHDPIVSDESARNEIFKRYKEGLSWEEVFEPIQNIEHRNRYIDLFNKIDEEGLTL